MILAEAGRGRQRQAESETSKWILAGRNVDRLHLNYLFQKCVSNNISSLSLQYFSFMSEVRLSSSVAPLLEKKEKN